MSTCEDEKMICADVKIRREDLNMICVDEKMICADVMIRWEDLKMICEDVKNMCRCEDEKV